MDYLYQTVSFDFLVVQDYLYQMKKLRDCYNTWKITAF